MLRRVGRELAYFGFFLALTIVLLWPHALHLDSAISDRGDPFHISWVLDWVLYALTHSPADLYDAPIFFPHRYALAYSENFIGIAILVLPFYLIGFEPLTIYNIAIVIGFTLSGYSACVLARQFVRRVPAALTAGILFAFVQYKFDHLAHLHVISTGWVPLLFAALVAYRRVPSLSRAVLLCLAFVMNGLTGIHWLLYGSLTVGITILFWLVAGSYFRSTRFWAQLVGALALGSLILIPFLLPYRWVANEYKMKRHPSEAAYFSATWSDWLMPAGRSAVYTPLRDSDAAKGERTLFPGLVPLFLTVAAIVLTRRRTDVDGGGQALLPVQESDSNRAPSPGLLRALDVAIVLSAALSILGAVSKRFAVTFQEVELLAIDSSDIPLMVLIALVATRCAFRLPLALGGDRGESLRTFFARSRFSVDEWSAGLWVLLGVVGALGMNAFFHVFLFRRVPILQSIRVPARWAIVAYAGLAVWSALGVAALMQRRTGGGQAPAWRRHASGALLLLLTLADVWPVIRWENVVTDPPLVYRWMKANRERLGPFVLLPVHGTEYEYLIGSTTHHIPIVNGLSSFEPPLYGQLRQKSAEGKFDEEFLRLIEQAGAHYVLVHVNLLGDPRPAMRWLRTGLDRGQLAFVRRFDNGPAGDYVFAITRNARNWEAMRGPQSPDGAGHIPDENLARFLGGQHTYSALTTWWVESPQPWAVVHRDFQVSGWALSPAGIREVKGCIDEGRQCFPARLVPRGDVARRRPWYPKAERPGFIIDMPRRPRGVRRETDLYLEIIDGNGKMTRTSDFPLYWH